MDITPRIMAYLGTEEGLTREACLDSDTPPNWTWAMGITAAAGIRVQDYVNRLAPMDVCIKASIAMVRAKYLPAVAHAFPAHGLNDAQVAAALSFQWNTGEITTAEWVKLWREEKATAARESLESHFTNGGILTARRKREAALFFANTWPADLRCPVWSVSRISHHPFKPVATDIMPILQSILGGK